jgi:DNA-binding winged helix-turn-helix (wHTH) protein/tetratricopeptide (TPR) repeat protein
MAARERSGLRFSPYWIPPDIDVLYRGDSVLPLERRAVQVLRYLAERHDRVVAKRELLDEVWSDVVTTDAVLKKAVLQVRRILGNGDESAPRIETYHGRGYRFVAPTVTCSADAPATSASSEGVTLHSSRDRVSIADPCAAPRPNYDQLIGRDSELAALTDEYRRTVAKIGQPVLIVGEAGIGKTQLSRAFGRWALEQGACLLQARFFDYGGSKLPPHDVFLRLLQQQLQAGTAGCSAAYATTLRDLVRQRFSVELPMEILMRFTAPHTADQDHGDPLRAIIPLGNCFIALSRERPLVIVLDDLQWADEASLELTGYLMRNADREALMLVALARSEVTLEPDHRLMRWLGVQASFRSYTTLQIKPLSAGECREAIGTIIGGTAATVTIPTHDVTRLHEITGGNPYFLTEMLRWLVAEGAIEYVPDRPVRWLGISTLRLPDTLMHAARAKYARLTEEIRDLLECASVLGDEFDVATLALMSERGSEAIESLLCHAVRHGVLCEQESAAHADFRFHHTILQQALYGSISVRRRRQLHSRAANAIERINAGDAERRAAALTVHYEAAGELERTIHWGIRAWQAASECWNWTEAAIAIERAHRAFRRLGPRQQALMSVSDRLKLLIGTGEGLLVVGKQRAADTVLIEAAQVADSSGDRRLLAAALLQRARAQSCLGNPRRAIRLTEEALAHYRELQDDSGIGLAAVELATLQVAIGKYANAAVLLRSVSDATVNSELASRADAIHGWACLLRGAHDAGVPLLEKALDHCERTGDVRQRGVVLRRLHWAHLSRGEFEAAVDLAVRGRDDFRSVGDINGEARLTMGIGQARIAQGLYAEGAAILQGTLEVFRTVGDLHCEAESLWLLGRAHLEMGTIDAAARLLEAALDAVRRVGDRDDEFRVQIDMARLQSSRGNYTAALVLASDAAVIAETLQSRDGLGLALVEQARALLQLRATREALSVAERAVQLLEETQSGEQWRGHRTLAGVLDIHSSPQTRERRLNCLRTAVALVARIRSQLSVADDLRRSGVTRAFRDPVRELHQACCDHALLAEAADLARSWALDSHVS